MKRKKEKTYSSTLKEVKFSYIKSENLSLEVNTAKLSAFLTSGLRELYKLGP